MSETTDPLADSRTGAAIALPAAVRAAVGPAGGPSALYALRSGPTCAAVKAVDPHAAMLGAGLDTHAAVMVARLHTTPARIGTAVTTMGASVVTFFKRRDPIDGRDREDC